MFPETDEHTLGVAQRVVRLHIKSIREILNMLPMRFDRWGGVRLKVAELETAFADMVDDDN